MPDEILPPVALRPRFFFVSAQHSTWLEGVVKAVVVLNLLDLLFTLVWVGSGHAEEANLLLDHLVRDHPLAFVVAKVSLVSFGSYLLWTYRSRPLAVIAIFVAFVAYYFVLLHHLHFTSAVFGLLW